MSVLGTKTKGYISCCCWFCGGSSEAVEEVAVILLPPLPPLAAPWVTDHRSKVTQIPLDDLANRSSSNAMPHLVLLNLFDCL